MKPTLCFLSAFMLCAALLADESTDEFSFPETIACGNGNILLSNVGNFAVTPSTWIRFSTNANYTVVCQIVYETSTFATGPSTSAEIMQVRMMENALNLALLKFLQKNYGSLSGTELIRKYRQGFVRAKVEDDFPVWFDHVRDTLGQFHKVTPIDDVTVQKVSMRAVGPFAEALENF